MKRHHTLSLILIVILLGTSIMILVNSTSENKSTAPFYVGVTFCGNTSAEAKLLIDRVKNYTNLFVLQSGPISKNETLTNEICDYAAMAGLHLIVYFGWFDDDCQWQLPWLDFAKQRWAQQFLGVYYYDEPGGIQLDYNWSRYFDYLKLQNSPMYQAHVSAIEAFMNGSLAQDYNTAAEIYVSRIQSNSGIQELKKRSITTFTSDYALYWFDYLGGYDVVLVQLGWNDTITKCIGLTRGAAQMQNKSWGAIITWKYTEPPYLDSGEAIYRQMLLAFKTGARYIAVFNYPFIGNNPYGILCDEHFEALERFWNTIVINKKETLGVVKANAALVLPVNYGWGMRRREDRIWYWQSDERMQKIWALSLPLIAKHGLLLDIIYDDPEFPASGRYKRVYYLNESI